MHGRAELKLLRFSTHPVPTDTQSICHDQHLVLELLELLAADKPTVTLLASPRVLHAQEGSFWVLCVGECGQVDSEHGFTIAV